MVAWFWTTSNPMLFPVYQAAFLNRESFVVLANYINFVGPWELILCTVFQLKHHCVRKPSDLCTINVSGLKFSKVRPASRNVIRVSQTWGGSWLSVHWTFRVPGEWESGHKGGGGSDKDSLGRNNIKIQSFALNLVLSLSHVRWIKGNNLVEVGLNWL